MIKKLLLLTLAGMVSIGASAVPARQGLRTFTQSDGTTIRVNVVGDERFHTMVTEDGLAVERHSDGNFYYRSSESTGRVQAHNPEQRGAVEQSFVKSNGTKLTVNSLAAASKDRLSARKAAGRDIKKASQVPQSGTPRVPIILVQYKDVKFKDADPNATFRDFFATGTKSARQYFVDQSNGKYNPEFDVYGPYTLESNRSVYGGNDSQGYDKGVGKMVAQGCQGLDAEIDFSKYDNNNDGECDVVIVLYAGDGEASSYDDDAENAVWPCQWELSDSDYGRSLRLDNTAVNKFAVFNELNGSDLSKIDGVGTFCHEFSHCLGLPDFYDTQYGPHFGMAHWSLMDYGCYNDDGYTPIGYSAYEKEFMGWIDIEEGKENTHYTLPVFNQKDITKDKAVKLTNSRDRNEYYILENRAQQGWDKYMPAEGLMIYHVTYSSSAWEGNTVNDYDMQRMTPVPADGSLKMDSERYYGETYYYINEADLLGDLWPYGNATELTDTSTPSADVNTGSKLGKPVTEITRNADGTISFWVMKAPLPAVAAPHSLMHTPVDATTMKISWAAGDSNDVTYTLNVSEHRDITYELASSTTFDSKDHGWEATGYAEYESAENAVRFGSNKNLGYLESPAFEVGDDGLVTVIFEAKVYSNDGSAVVVSLLDNKGYEVASTETGTLTSAYKRYAVVLEGVPDTKMKVEFSTTGKKQRFYLKSADIYRGDASELLDSSSKARANAASSTYNMTITDISGTEFTVVGLTNGVIYDYKVKAVPTDDTKFASSNWSDTQSFEMNAADITGVDAIEAEVEAEYYDLQGVRMHDAATLAPGVYIVKKGNKVAKIIVK